MDDLTKRALNAFDTASRLGVVTAKNMPYYKHTYADMVLSTIAECHKDKSTITWSAGGQSYNTLYLKWRQARQYIKDNLRLEVRTDSIYNGGSDGHMYTDCHSIQLILDGEIISEVSL